VRYVSEEMESVVSFVVETPWNKPLIFTSFIKENFSQSCDIQ